MFIHYSLVKVVFIVLFKWARQVSCGRSCILPFHDCKTGDQYDSCKSSKCAYDRVSLLHVAFVQVNKSIGGLISYHNQCIFVLTCPLMSLEVGFLLYIVKKKKSKGVNVSFEVDKLCIFFPFKCWRLRKSAFWCQTSHLHFVRNEKPEGLKLSSIGSL